MSQIESREKDPVCIYGFYGPIKSGIKEREGRGSDGTIVENVREKRALRHPLL